MEGLNWIRLGAIAALVLGSLYVLLPTALEATSATVPVVNTGVDIDQGPDRVPLTVVDGDRAAVVEAIEQRLAVAGVTVGAVKAEDEADIIIELGEATSDAVTGVLGRSGDAVVVDVDDVVDAVPEASREAFEEHVAALVPITEPAEGPDGDAAREKLEAARTGLVETLVDATIDDEVFAGSTPRAVLNVAVEGDPPVLTAVLAPTSETPAAERALLVDRAIVALVDKDDRLVTFDADNGSTLAKLVSLPGDVQAKRGKAQKSDEEEEAPKATAPANAPAWLVGLLPNTRIERGLDLQGGIDLTLQVELDTALLNQAKRDTQGLVEKAAEEDLTLDQVTRRYGEPVIEVTSDVDLSSITAFMRKQFGTTYQYSESEGTLHRFEMSDERRTEVEDQSMTQVLETLRKRIDATGVKEPAIVRKGDGRINVQLPGLEDPGVALDVIRQAAVLEFHMVDMEFDVSLLEDVLNRAQETLAETAFFDDELLNKWLHDTGRLDRDRIVRFSEPGNEQQWEGVGIWPRKRGKEGTVLEASPMVLFEKVELTGNDINNAAVSFDQQNQAGVSLDFKPRGGQIFCDLTKDAVGQRFAIVLDKAVMSAPNIRERICGGSARIDMGASLDPLGESKALALVLRTGALDAPVVVASVNQVGASLGADAIRSGAIGAVVGAAIVLVFMALWYRTAGLIADFALVVNVLMVLAALASFEATLTLPGIAGIALTIGMAVDANIIIYERIREELRLGVQPRKAVDTGFDKAAVAVLDANITTAIAGIVLYSYGTGPIKGFAVTLLIGIGTTLVTALFVTRTIMELVTRSSTARLRI